MTDTITFFLSCASLVLDSPIPDESETPDSKWRATYTRNPTTGRVRIDLLERCLGMLDNEAVWIHETLPLFLEAHIAERLRCILDEAELLAQDDVDVIDEETRLIVREPA